MRIRRTRKRRMPKAEAGEIVWAVEVFDGGGIRARAERTAADPTAAPPNELHRSLPIEKH
ncbi:MAG: hypothetical protein NZ534_07570 [Bacteroidia bacterium]|nr:hypothetical protein [Bacteroidia bacterium]